MPAIGANGGSQRGASLPRIAAKPAPAPRVIVQAPSLPPLLNTTAVHATAPAPVHTNTTGGSDAATSGPGYGAPEANRYKATPAYHQAVKAVFRAQPPQQQAAIIHGITSIPQVAQGPESRAVKEAFSQLPLAQKNVVLHYLGPMQARADRSLGLDVGGALLNVFHDLLPQSVDYSKMATGLSNETKPVTDAIQHGLQIGSGAFLKGASALHLIGQTDTQRMQGLIGRENNIPSTPEQLLLAGGDVAASAINKLPTASHPLIGRPTSQATLGATTLGGMDAGTVAKNALKDAVNLPAEVGPSIALPVGAALSGHWKDARDMTLKPFADAVNDPAIIGQHPLDYSLVLGGVLDPAAALVESGVRRVAGKGPVDLRAEPIHLTANLTRQRPDWSRYPIRRGGQKSVANQRYRRTENGLLVPKNEQVRGTMAKIEASRLIGENERVRRADHEKQMAAHASDFVKSLPARAAKNVKEALKLHPEPAYIPGHSVASLISQGIIRRAETFKEDIQKVLDIVKPNRAKLSGTGDLQLHDQFVADLEKALKDNPSSKDLAHLFKSSAKYVTDRAPMQAALGKFGHYRDMTAESLRRRELVAAARVHMPGVRMDPEKGLVRDVPNAENQRLVQHLQARQARIEQSIPRMAPADRAAATRALQRIDTRIKQLPSHDAVPVPTAEMERFVMGETRGRPVGYVEHTVRARDEKNASSAHYTNQERLPPVATNKQNTLYAFEHGLIDPTHEALLRDRVKTQGALNGYRSMGRLLSQMVLKQPNHNWWTSYADAARDSRVKDGTHVPIRISDPYRPNEALTGAIETTNLATLEHEAIMRGLDFNRRLDAPTNSAEPGHHGLIDKAIADHLRGHENMISPNAFYRSIRSLNTQFKTVALTTSFRHLPGVLQETLIRAVASGTGPISWFASRQAFDRAEQLDPTLGRERRIQRTGGGNLSGQIEQLRTHQTSRHFAGTPLYRPLHGLESFLHAPGVRALRAMWKGQQYFVVHGTKVMLESQAAHAAIGKQLINDFAGRHGLLAALTGHWGQMIEKAAQGILDEHEAQRLGAVTRRAYGRWTDMTPAEQSAMMFTPFGLWWTNSIGWLARLPIDHPLGAAFLGALNAGTEKQRVALGLDMFAPGHLPLYKQGGIPIAGQLLGANYYSPFGTFNDPGGTAASLVLPWAMPILYALAGKNWRLETITSPNNPKGRGKPGWLDVMKVIGNSIAGSFVPLYTKAQTVVEGGAPKYDTSTLIAPQTKGRNPGPIAGLKKATSPIRLSPITTAGSTSKKSGWGSGNGWGSSGGTGSGSGWGSSGGGWGSSGGGWGG